MMKIHISLAKKVSYFFKKNSFVLVVDKLFMYKYFQFSQKKNVKTNIIRKQSFKKFRTYRKRFVKLFFIVVLLYLPLDLVLESERDLRRCPPEFSAEAPSNP